MQMVIVYVFCDCVTKLVDDLLSTEDPTLTTLKTNACFWGFHNVFETLIAGLVVSASFDFFGPKS